MDLQALQNATRSDHLHARHEKAKRLYKLGLEYLQRARDMDWDRVLLRNAARCFASAIEHNRKDPAPYLKQAFLFSLSGNRRKSIHYLKEAQRLDPQNAEMQQLLSHLQSATPVGTTTKAKKPPDLQQLAYQKDKLCIELQQVMSKAYRELPELQPTWAKPVWMGYCRLRDEFAANYQRLCRMMDRLTPHVDVSDVDLDLQKLEISLNRLDDVCEHSDNMVKLYQRIAHLEKLFTQQLYAAQQKKMTPEQGRTLLDKYERVLDEMADELDIFEGSGMSIQRVLSPYEKTVALYQSIDACFSEGVS